MHKISAILACVLLATLLLAVGCANIVSPSGGLRDQVGPRLDSVTPVIPPHETVYFEGNQIIFQFDEFIRPGNYGSEVFITPLPENPPDVKVIGKKLVIELNDDLLPNTTYVLRIGQGIKDFTEGNQMPKPIIFAFSTGGAIDSLFVSGTIFNPLKKGGESELLVLLYPSDSIDSTGFLGKRPFYATTTDSAGRYELPYLKRGDYKITAIRDLNKNYKYDEGEPLASGLSPDVIFADTSVSLSKNLVFFVPDDDPPALRQARWLNAQNLQLVFTEPVMIHQGESISLFDSSRSISADAQFSFFNQNQSVLVLNSPLDSSRVSSVVISNLRDTLGNALDTTVNISPLRSIREAKDLLLLPPVFDQDSAYFYIQFYYPPDSTALVKEYVSIKDSSGNAIPFDFLLNRFSIKLIPEFPEEATLAEIRINDSLFPSQIRSDSVFKWQLPLAGRSNFGKVFGTVNTDSMQTPWIGYLVNMKGKKIRKITDDTFNFPNLQPGEYRFFFFHDRDKNGFWSPGSYDPLEFPEEIYVEPTVLKVRANWEIEDLHLKPLPTQKALER